MAYLVATRYGLTRMSELPEYLREAGWEPGWEHKSGYKAMRMPGEGDIVWLVLNPNWERVGEGWSSSLRAAARRIERLDR